MWRFVLKYIWYTNTPTSLPQIGGLDITSCRNMYGRQQASFEAPLQLHEGALQEGIYNFPIKELLYIII